MTAGELDVLAIFDKPDPLEGPFFEETIYVTPSREPGEVRSAIVETTRHAARALGLYDGPIHAEMRVNGRGVYILEVAARPIGGLCARAMQFESDWPGQSLTLEELIILHALRKAPRRRALWRPASGVMMIPVPRAGVYESVSGLDDARSVRGIDDVVITAKPGQKLVPLPEGSSYTGFIFASGVDPVTVEQSLRLAHSRLEFQIFGSLDVVSDLSPDILMNQL